MLTLRNVFIVLAIIFFTIGALFASLSSRSAQTVLLERVLTERAGQVQALGDTLFSSGEFVAPSGRSASSERILPILQKFASASVDRVGDNDGLAFLRFIHIGSRQILASSNKEENDLFFTRLPELAAQVKTVHIDPEGNEVDITYRGSDTYAIWLGVSKSEVLSSGGVLVRQQQVFTILLIILLLALLFAVGFFFIKRPMAVLRGALDATSKGRFDTRIPKSANAEFGRLFDKFNQMISSMSTVHERDEMVSSMKSDFITTAAHQLRTPLSAVKWALKVILDQDFGPLNIDQKSILLKGYESNDRMIRLVNDLLDVDRIDSGRLEYQFGPTDLVNLIESVIVVLTPRITEQNITVEFPGKEAKIAPVRADIGKLRQVVQNIIDNAVKYSLKGGKVIIYLEQQNDVVTVSVADSGIGIPKEQQGKLFGKFFRADNARKLQTDGSGLGLYIMKQIVEKHGGNVSFISEEDKGTTFSFTVPVYKSG